MNAEQAKQILQHYRPTVDDNDPQFAEALALARRDPQLAAWLAGQSASYDALRRKLRQTPVPADLRDRILARQPARAPVVWWRRPAFAVGLVALALLLNVVGYFAFWRETPGVPVDPFTAYLNTTTAWAASGYSMDAKTSDPEALRRLFAERGSPTDYVLMPGLAALSLEGGNVLNWDGHKVSVLCYETPGQEGGDVWLFVCDRTAIPQTPATETPRFTTVNGLAAATWTRGDRLYVLAARGSRADLEKLL